MTQPTVLLCEDNFTGHRWNYVELLAREALAAGVGVHLATTAQGNAEMLSVAGSAPQLPVSILGDASLRSLAAEAERLGVQRVVIPDADRYALRLAVPGSWPSRLELRLLVMREHAQPRSNPLITTGVEHLRRTLFALATRRSNVRLYYLASALAEIDSRHVPDPVTLEADDSPPVDLEQDRFWFAVLGALDERKNVPVVIQAMELLGDEAVGLVLAGRMAPEVARQVASSAGKAPRHIIDARLTDGELDALVKAVDCLVLLYSNSAPSGMVAKAAAAGTRVILPDTPAYRKDSERLGDGSATCHIDPASAAHAMRSMLARPAMAPLPLGSELFVTRLML